jgi:hypothetical protein
MYPAALFVHSWLRWVVIVLAVLAVLRAVRGRSARAAWQHADDAVGQWFVIALDVQVLIGLMLSFVLSPMTGAFWSDMGAGMSNAPLRFLAIEHLVGMIVAMALAHTGRIRVRRRSDSKERHTQSLVFNGLALLVMLLSIPWPFTEVGAPLLRGL